MGALSPDILAQIVARRDWERNTPDKDEAVRILRWIRTAVGKGSFDSRTYIMCICTLEVCASFLLSRMGCLLLILGIMLLGCTLQHWQVAVINPSERTVHVYDPYARDETSVIPASLGKRTIEGASEVQFIISPASQALSEPWKVRPGILMRCRSWSVLPAEAYPWMSWC